MLNRRKAAIGYATYMVGSRVAKHVVRRTAREMMTSARESARPQPRPRLRRRRMIPLVGGAAAAIAGAAVLASRHRTANGAD